jgi:hypothetical protein
MIKRKRQSNKIQIDLTGPQGNAFFILGTASRLCKQLGRTDTDAILDEMKSGDYEHLLEVFEREFGDLVIMYR